MSPNSELKNIYEIGEITAQEVYQWFQQDTNKELINQLDLLGINLEYINTSSNIENK
ncbi:MAG: hypothetical protein K2L64_00360 [Ureaplasma sp.]|nr:hypothetical protein [Ureaplasma sp.]